MLYAVCLAGVPGRIINEVLNDLKKHYSDTFVFRGPGATLRADNLAQYDADHLAEILRLSADAIFRKTKRPHGFCRSAVGGCIVRNGSSRGCGRLPEQTCSYQKPDFFIVFYQEGREEARIKESFHHSALLRQIPMAFYNKKDRTRDFIISEIKKCMPLLGTLSHQIKSSNSPLLLPPLNFGMNDLINLLIKAPEREIKGEIKQFKRAYLKNESRAYAGRGSLSFKPAENTQRHGLPTLHETESIAISRIFRLGCQYEPNLHFDVSRNDGSDLGGKSLFSCRERGSIRPRGTHVNITVDDCFIGNV
ncbi:hypothetical protein [Bosea vestrisii]|uniref:Uncharacterized protein n=1 Tax=Bosea vestrisii TaxID=151416 RepID=A0ABW0H659_9HYPH